MGCDAHRFVYSPRRASWRVRQREVERLLPQLVFGLLQLHRLGVVHQDLRSANILLSTGADDPCDETTVCLVADLGKAVCHRDPHHHYHSRAADPTRVVRLGAGVYEAPEHADCSHGQSGVPTDMWALGMTFVELLLNRVEDAPATPSMTEYLESPSGKLAPRPFTALFDYSSSRVQEGVLCMFQSESRMSWEHMLPYSLGQDGRALVARLLHSDHARRPANLEEVWQSPYIRRLCRRNGFRLESGAPEMLPPPRRCPQALASALAAHGNGSPVAEAPAWPIDIRSNGERETASAWSHRSFEMGEVGRLDGDPPLPATPAEILLRMCTLGGAVGLGLSSIFRAQRLFHTALPHGSVPDASTLGSPELVALVLASLSLASKVSGAFDVVTVCCVLETLLAYRWVGVAVPSLRQVAQAECDVVNFAGSCLFAPTLVSVIDLTDFDGRAVKGAAVVGMIGWHVENPGVDPVLANLSGLDLLRFRREVEDWVARSGLVSWKKTLAGWVRSVERETPFPLRSGKGQSSSLGIEG
jgi:hypothetical protein